VCVIGVRSVAGAGVGVVATRVHVVAVDEDVDDASLALGSRRRRGGEFMEAW
jgi:hypothetical protein